MRARAQRARRLGRALYADRTEEFANYNGMISAVDSAVGNVTAALKANGMWARSRIVFTSDNGGPSAKTVSGAAANNWPLRGGKHGVGRRPSRPRVR